MKIINKDITTLKKGILIQQVNCQNAMGSGVAKAIYQKLPQVKTDTINLLKIKSQKIYLAKSKK